MGGGEFWSLRYTKLWVLGKKYFAQLLTKVGVIYTPGFVKIPDGVLRGLVELTWNDLPTFHSPHSPAMQLVDKKLIGIWKMCFAAPKKWCRIACQKPVKIQYAMDIPILSVLANTLPQHVKFTLIKILFCDNKEYLSLFFSNFN